MAKLNIELETGELEVDGLILDVKDKKEEKFIVSDFFQKLFKENEIKELISHHFLLENVQWKDKLFELTIRPHRFDNIPFMLYLVDKQGEYYSSLSDWEKRTEIPILEKEVNHLCEWLIKKMNLTHKAQHIDNGKRWVFDWGTITISYETRSFNCGIYIIYY